MNRYGSLAHQRLNQAGWGAEEPELLLGVCSALMLTGITEIQVWRSCVAFCLSHSVLCQRPEGQSLFSL